MRHAWFLQMVVALAQGSWGTEISKWGPMTGRHDMINLIIEAMRAMLMMTVEAIHPAIGFPLLALLRHLLLNRPEDHCWSEACEQCMSSPWLHRQRLVARFCQRTQLSASHPRALVEELNIEIIIIIFLILILIIIVGFSIKWSKVYIGVGIRAR